MPSDFSYDSINRSAQDRLSHNVFCKRSDRASGAPANASKGLIRYSEGYSHIHCDAESKRKKVVKNADVECKKNKARIPVRSAANRSIVRNTDEARDILKNGNWP